ncbi:MAG: helix-turn-helix domain-containing protein [Paracoccaceae bacterium]|nr:MAG: helix-turn-helix domain-containing protein [Paracoccaceae bacterium]
MADITNAIPAWQLYGETRQFPDILHVERIADRAAGLDWRIAPHRHLHLHQMFLLSAGGATVTLEGAVMQPALPALLNVPPGTVHGFAFAAGTGGYVLSLPVMHFEALLAPGAETGAAARPFLCAADAAVADLFAALAADHAAADPMRRTRLAARAPLIVCHALSLAPAPQSSAAAVIDPRLARFEALMTAHLRDRWGVADFARALATSPRHLSRLCRAATGLSAQGRIESHRVREACRLLVYTRMPVASVGYAAGWSDPSYFSRSFRRATGLSPLDYRARFDG